MERAALIGVRYVLPVALIAAGFVLLFAGTDSNRWDGFAMCVGAGLAVALLNALFRFGATGDRERADEEEARRFFTQHGHWPDEEGPPGR
jgi:hypothetical protein